MTKYGYQQSWQYIIEDSNENPPTGVQFRLPGRITGETPITPRFNTKEYYALKQPTDTDMRAADDIRPTKNEYAWSMSYVPLKRSSSPKYDFRHFHNAALNASSSTAVAGAWTHGTGVTTAINTFTIFKEIDNVQHQLNGCKIGRLSVRCSVDNPVEVSVEGLASAATFADLSRTDASSLRDGTPFMWEDVRVYIDSALATFCTAFEYTIDNKGKTDHVLGNRDPNAIALGGRSVELAITRQYNDTAQYADAKGGTAKRITIRFDDATDADVVFTNCKYDDHPVPGAGDPGETLTHVLRLKAEAIATN